MLCRLNDELAQRSERGETVALIIDEAQNLRRETLEEIRFLANPSPKRPRLVQEIFVGDPQFEKNLSSRGLMVLNQRFEVRCRLRPLTPEESLGYIENRLNRAGSIYIKGLHAEGCFPDYPNLRGKSRDSHPDLQGDAFDGIQQVEETDRFGQCERSHGQSRNGKRARLAPSLEDPALDKKGPRRILKYPPDSLLFRQNWKGSKPPGLKTTLIVRQGILGSELCQQVL